MKYEVNPAGGPAEFVRFESRLATYFSNGLPGETNPRRWIFAVSRLRSASEVAAARRFRKFLTFSLRVRRRRISGRRLGADMKTLLG